MERNYNFASFVILYPLEVCQAEFRDSAALTETSEALLRLWQEAEKGVLELRAIPSPSADVWRVFSCGIRDAPSGRRGSEPPNPLQYGSEQVPRDRNLRHLERDAGGRGPRSSPVSPAASSATCVPQARAGQARMKLARLQARTKSCSRTAMRAKVSAHPHHCHSYHQMSIGIAC